MEAIKGDFQVQLATVMDTVLTAAVCEIMKIFEHCLSEHQAALLQKTNEMSALRNELEKVERRHAVNDLMETPRSEPERQLKHEPDKIAHSHKGQSLIGIKEEAESDDESQQKQNVSMSNMVLTSIQVSETQLVINQQESLSRIQPKDETLHWEENYLTAAQQHEEDSCSHPQPLSPKVCSDAGWTNGWLPDLNTTQKAAIENIQSNNPIWSSPLNGHNRVDVEETFSEDSGTFLTQESENPASIHGTMQSLQREEGGPKNYKRHGQTLRSRDRIQTNFHTLALQNTVHYCPADTGVIGRPYSCPFCAKCFAYPSHQRRHLLRHTGARLHSCQFCDKRFLTPSELTVHTRTHTGERPFTCGQCGKRFARSGNLRAHQRDVHMGKRPFACTECGKRFAHKGNLRVHNRRVHHGQQQSHTGSDTV